MRQQKPAIGRPRIHDDDAVSVTATLSAKAVAALDRYRIERGAITRSAALREILEAMHAKPPRRK